MGLSQCKPAASHAFQIQLAAGACALNLTCPRKQPQHPFSALPCPPRFIHWAAADGWYRLGSRPPVVRSVLRVLNETMKAQLDMHVLEQDRQAIAGATGGNSGGSGGGGSGGSGTLDRTCRRVLVVELSVV